MKVKNVQTNTSKINFEFQVLTNDHIDQSGGLASTIKTHHNDTNLVRQLRANGRVVEPLKDFHKDEVQIIILPDNYISLEGLYYY